MKSLDWREGGVPAPCRHASVMGRNNITTCIQYEFLLVSAALFSMLSWDVGYKSYRQGRLQTKEGPCHAFSGMVESSNKASCIKYPNPRS